MDINNLQREYKQLGKNREAGFIQKFYVEHKTPKQITEELYLNSKWTYYKLKAKVRDKIKETYNLENKQP